MRSVGLRKIDENRFPGSQRFPLHLAEVPLPRGARGWRFAASGGAHRSADGCDCQAEKCVSHQIHQTRSPDHGAAVQRRHRSASPTSENFSIATLPEADNNLPVPGSSIARQIASPRPVNNGRATDCCREAAKLASTVTLRSVPYTRMFPVRIYNHNWQRHPQLLDTGSQSATQQHEVVG